MYHLRSCFALCIGLSLGCATGPYRVVLSGDDYVPVQPVTLKVGSDYCRRVCANGRSRCQANAASLERVLDAEQNELYRLAYVEFDDQGAIWSSQQILDSIGALKDLQAKGDGVIFVTFVHGFNHNASVCDENVVQFREVLQKLSNTPRTRSMHANEAPSESARGTFYGSSNVSLARFKTARRRASPPIG